jgi:hypothetical protein
MDKLEKIGFENREQVCYQTRFLYVPLRAQGLSG